MVLSGLEVEAEVGRQERTADLRIGSGGYRLREDDPLPPAEPDGTLSSSSGSPHLHGHDLSAT